MDPTCRGKDTSVSLSLTQQFDPLLRVGNGDDGRTLNGFERDLHHVTVVTFQRQHIAGDGIVLNNELHQCLLIVIAVSDGATNLWALKALPAKWDCSQFLS